VTPTWPRPPAWRDLHGPSAPKPLRTALRLVAGA
jgi:hypothetical protein